MRAKQRLDRVESALTPQEAVLRWLAEACAYPTFTAYMASLLGQPKSSYPSVRLPVSAADAVKDELRGQSDGYVAKQAAQAMLVTGFLVIFVGVVNAAIEATLGVERLRAAGLGFWQAALKLKASVDTSDAVEVGDWADWHRATQVHHDELVRVGAALRLAEEHHYAGMHILFPEPQAEWSTTCDGALRAISVTDEDSEADESDPEALLAGWELQAWTELFRDLGLLKGAMSLADDQLRRLEEGTKWPTAH